MSTALQTKLPGSLKTIFRHLDQAGRPLRLDELTAVLTDVHLRMRDLRGCIQFREARYWEQVLCVREHYEVRCLCWRSHQWSSVHDHRGSACCVRVVAGVLTTTDFSRRADVLLEPVRTFDVPAGGLLGRQDRDIHRVGNRQNGLDLVTLHMYSPPLRREAIAGFPSWAELKWRT